MNIKDTEKKIVKPSQEKVWYKHYAPEAIEQLKEKMPEQTLWKYISTAIKADNDQHDAMVYFGRHIKQYMLIMFSKCFPDSP